MKRSWQPPFWLMFGAGGMLSALLGWMLVYLTGVAAPLNLFSAGSLLTYENTIAFARHPLGKLFVFLVISLFLWHAAHRIYHTLHDIGVRAGPAAWLSCYGIAAAVTVLTAYRLLAIGF